MDGNTNAGPILKRASSSRLVKQFNDLNFDDDTISIDRGHTAKAENRFVFECAWEVANKGLFCEFKFIYRPNSYFLVGGIYTVLRTKAPVSTDELGDQYCMLGPYFEDRVKLEVEVLEPETVHMKYTLEQMQEWGFKCVYGRWLIDGYPKVVLFDIGSAAWKLDAWKHEVILYLFIFNLYYFKCSCSYLNDVKLAYLTMIKKRMIVLFLAFW